MPHIQCPDLTVTVTTASADGTLLIAPSVENLFPGAQCSIINSAGTVSQMVQIVELVDATHLRVRIIVPQKLDGYFHGKNYGYSNMAAPTDFSGGKLTQHQGVVPVEFDYTSVFRV